MSMNVGGSGGPSADINMTPLIDVLLVLLIIFMVTAPLLTAGVPVELPDSRANPLDQEPEQVTISIDREGYIYIDRERVVVGGFPEALDTLRAGGEPPQVTLRADKSLDYGRVMAVMGELNRSGFNSISLVTSGSVKTP